MYMYLVSAAYVLYIKRSSFPNTALSSVQKSSNVVHGLHVASSVGQLAVMPEW